MEFTTISKMGDHNPNEDSIGCFLSADRLCAVVADGLGGHGGGEVASAAAVCAVEECFKGISDISQDAIVKCFDAAHNALQHKKNEKHRYLDMKTTLAVIITDGRRYLCAHAGDTRIYLFSEKKAIFQTKDHSVPQMLVQQGRIKAEKIRYHEDRNRLLKVMGPETMPKISYTKVSRIPLKTKGILLCTDGFWEHIKENKMIKFLRESDCSQKWLGMMEEEILKNAKGKVAEMDNYSAIAIKLI